MWDINTGECLHVLMGHVAAVRCVQYDGRLVVSGAYDYMVIDLFFEFYVLVSEKLKIDPNLKGLVWLGSGLDKIKIRFSGSGILKTRVFGVGFRIFWGFCTLHTIYVGN